ncbi:dihydrolipoamide acetyltransferase family protein [Alkaliphilus sp. B6464]|uniref:dihydrolipoamide acetyltransferase family protein n=1 Tax=Alkaliphilus sp. B6464 TaxID=2731219 RepID=UPI001BAC93C8|nr:dihydrolipoamide acetyltransferase family protein [Alkaliphilus sp. B6464]QUH20118.1 2-oxo acid dehydrogenase subunit E2 [Alkaliphilus sp. B6464]
MFKFKFPDIGEGITEGILTKWLVKVGDNIKEGDSLFEVETDKVTTEIPSPASGIIDKLNGEEGEVIYVGNVVVEIVTDNKGESAIDILEEGQTVKSEKVEEENAGVVGALEVSNEIMESSTEGRNTEVKEELKKKVLATPMARKIAHDLNININEIIGTGPQGRVMKADIQNEYNVQDNKLKDNENIIVDNKENISANVKENTIAGYEQRIKLTSLRRTIAKNMAKSMYTAPHALCMDEVDVTELVNYREKVKNLFIDDKDIKFTYLPFIIKAVTLALKDNPKFNAQLDEENDEYIIKKYYNIGIAVDTEDGLVVPIIRNADKIGMLELMEESIRLSKAARDKKLKLDEIKGSTFTITNFGSLGLSTGMPIINYPEVAILGVGKIEQKPVVIDGEIVIRWILPLALSIDHRVLDGGDAGRFIDSLKTYITNPDRLILY